MADQAAVDRVMAGEKNLFREDLSGANFAGMNLSRRVFSQCDFSGADLSNTDMRWCDLTSCDLKGAKLDGADMHSARLSGARIDSPKKTATDLLAAIQVAIANVEGQKSWMDLSVTVYPIPGCTIIQGKPGTSAFTLVFDGENDEKPESDAAEKLFSYPSLKRYGDWPIRFKIDDREIEPVASDQSIGSIRTKPAIYDAMDGDPLVEPVADIQLGEE